MNQLENCQARYRSNTWMGRTLTDGPDEFELSKFDCIFFNEKISFSLKLFSGNFYGQSFIKTVRGPLLKSCKVKYIHIVDPRQCSELRDHCRTETSVIIRDKVRTEESRQAQFTEVMQGKVYTYS